MAADLFLPLFFIVIMYIIIAEMETGLNLIMIAVLFMPVSLAFSRLVSQGGFTLLFGADITALDSGLNWIIGASMFTIPIFAATRVLYLRRELEAEKKRVKAGNKDDK